jgi:hypothetical protein
MKLNQPQAQFIELRYLRTERQDELIVSIERASANNEFLQYARQSRCEEYQDCLDSTIHTQKIFPAIVREKIPCQKFPLYPEICSLSVAGNFPYIRKEFIPTSEW